MVVLRQWAICITATSIVGAVIYALAPKGKTEKAMKVIISVFFLCALLSPFLTGEKFNFKDEIKLASTTDYKETKELKSNINNQMIDVSKHTIEQQIKNILYANKITCGQICANMDINEDKSIFIKTIEVFLPSNEYFNNKSKVIKLLKDNLKINENQIIVTESKSYD